MRCVRCPSQRQVQGSPSELSTAPTACEEALHDGCELAGLLDLMPHCVGADAVLRLTSAGSSSKVSDAGGDTAWGALLDARSRTLEKGLAPPLSLELPVKVFSDGRISRHVLHQASTQELEQSLSAASRQARRLWKGVADLEQVEHDLQARLQATGSRPGART
eukprot:g23239.t1